jgi:hypothetical protein
MIKPEVDKGYDPNWLLDTLLKRMESSNDLPMDARSATRTCGAGQFQNLVPRLAAPPSHAVPAIFLKRRNPRLFPSEDQRMNVMCTFVGVHDFQVHHVADYAELIGDAVAAQHVARHPGNI